MKYQSGYDLFEHEEVALFTRAWIEILHFTVNPCCNCVALFTRAWIEMSTSLRGQGRTYVALFTRAWIEIFISFATPLRILSPSLRGRGLKYAGTMQERLTSGSPSLRGRGLKFRIPSSEIYIVTVALFARAWIEIISVVFVLVFKLSRPLCEGVD